MKSMLLICIVYISLQSTSPDVILKKHNIDLDLKSHKGWIRILNSDHKLLKYGYQLNSNEKKILKDYLTNIKESRSRSIR